MAKNVFHCFSCQAGGNVLDLLAALEKGPIREAARRLQGGGAGADPVEPVSTPTIAASPVPAQNLPLGFELADVDRAHPYVIQRGILGETAQIFQIGVYRGPGTMPGRLVIPIHDEHGGLVAYAGRAIDGVQPKYKLPVGFHKSLTLFNLHRALRACSRRAIVVEGFFDCMRVHQAGVPNGVALMGISLSPKQRELLVANFEELILMLDGDEAGCRASERIAANLAGDIRLKVVAIPRGQQPDQLGAGELRHLLGQAGEGGPKTITAG